MAGLQKPVIAITMGDPCGIGPEVISKALAHKEVYDACRPVVIGNSWCMEQAVELTGRTLRVREVESPSAAGLSPEQVDVVDIHNLNLEDVTVGEISPACGKAAMEWVTRAAELAIAGQVNSLATAPINKEAASLAGYKSIGHMELLQEISGSPDVATMLMTGSLRVVHLSTHRSLRRACDYVTREGILAKLALTHHSFTSWGVSSPRIGVAALNPHGSDGGLLGNEEAEEISPAVQEARSRGIDAYGPVPADIVFHQAIPGSLRRRSGYVPRPGPHTGKGLRVRKKYYREPGPALRSDFRRPRNGFRYCRQGHCQRGQHAGSYQSGRIPLSRKRATLNPDPHPVCKTVPVRALPWPLRECHRFVSRQ